MVSQHVAARYGATVDLGRVGVWWSGSWRHPDDPARSVEAWALTIARTEMLRPYREVTQERFKTSQMVETWTWLATLDRRTCPMCAAIPGRRLRRHRASPPKRTP